MYLEHYIAHVTQNKCHFLLRSKHLRAGSNAKRQKFESQSQRLDAVALRPSHRHTAEGVLTSSLCVFIVDVVTLITLIRDGDALFSPPGQLADSKHRTCSSLHVAQPEARLLSTQQTSRPMLGGTKDDITDGLKWGRRSPPLLAAASRC